MKHLFWIFVFLRLSAVAGNFPDKPLNYVTDEANVIDDTDEAMLNKKLHAFQDSTSTQIFVYVASSLNGADMTLLSQEIFGAWDIGQKGKNNGVLIAVFINDHKFRIHTGYGMEGVLPDVLTKRIQDEEMRPLFKENNYYEGINAGVDKLIYYSKHEYKPDEYSTEDAMGGFIIFYVLTIILYGLLFLILHFAYKENKGLKKVMLGICGVLGLIPAFGFFIVLAILVVFAFITLIRKISKSSGSWSSGSSGTTFYSGSSWSSSSDSDSSWSSSSSDSDFGGGGGGDSGGGGSSSDW